MQGVQLLSEYIGAESTVSTQGQGVQLLTVGTWGQGVQLLTVGTWGAGSSCLQWVHGGKGA